ncbi:hypothetical protein DESA109040_03945 [Deinococcus saxicola]|uniref:hypothetical protein n=1 Tax=Deinococcus saxicola TaxID=249406 RepID=UPI0039EEECEC
MLMIMVAFLAGQFFAGLARVILFDDASRTALVLSWLTLVITGLTFGGGLIYLCFQTRQGRQV